MTNLIGISGSLRKASFNTALLRAAATLLPADTSLDIRTLHGIPLYDGDLEAAQGVPASVSALKQAVIGADGVLLVTPEYNNGIPGRVQERDRLAVAAFLRHRASVRRPDDRADGDLPGPFGTTLSQAAWLPVLRTLGTSPWFGARLLVSHANDVFDPALAIKDAAVKERVRLFLAGFVDAVRRSKR